MFGKQAKTVCAVDGVVTDFMNEIPIFHRQPAALVTAGCAEQQQLAGPLRARGVQKDTSTRDASGFIGWFRRTLYWRPMGPTHANHRLGGR